MNNKKLDKILVDIYYYSKSLSINQSGVHGGNRTHDLFLRREALYPTELREHMYIITHLLSFYNSLR